MPKIKHHIKNFRQIVFLSLVLFSLSPCTVKEVVFNVFNTDYFKPLNKSKITVPTSPCSYSHHENIHFSIIKRLKINKLIAPDFFCDHLNFTVYSFKVHNGYTKNTSGNSPPKYILYKRWKIDIA